ncbi:hypothetical protein SVIOM342S_04029 [Streptomyces violaceorubidus]
MRRLFARTLARPLVLAAAATAIPLGSAAPAAADSIVVRRIPGRSVRQPVDRRPVQS